MSKQYHRMLWRSQVVMCHSVGTEGYCTRLRKPLRGIFLSEYKGETSLITVIQSQTSTTELHDLDVTDRY